MKDYLQPQSLSIVEYRRDGVLACCNLVGGTEDLIASPQHSNTLNLKQNHNLMEG